MVKLQDKINDELDTEELSKLIVKQDREFEDFKLQQICLEADELTQSDEVESMFMHEESLV